MFSDSIDLFAESGSATCRDFGPYSSGLAFGGFSWEVFDELDFLLVVQADHRFDLAFVRVQDDVVFIMVGLRGVKGLFRHGGA